MVYHFNRHLLVRMPGGQFGVLRFHDPLVFEHLRWILNSVQLAALMGPADAWYWQDTYGQWQCELRPELRTYSLTLNAKQVETLGRTGVLNRTLKQLRRENPSRNIDNTFVRQLDALLDRAYNQQGLSQAADVVLFALQAMNIHLEIHQHPTLLACLNEARAGNCTYVRACRNVNYDELQTWVDRDVFAFKEIQ